MAFIVETGAGTPGANAYAATTFITAYLTERNRATENGWTAASEAVKQAAGIAATDYIETRWGPYFKGRKARLLIDGREASGSVTFTANPLDAEELTVGQRTYRFVAALAQEDDVLIGATLADTIDNLVLAINAPSSDTDVVHEDTFVNYEVYADAGEADDVLLVAQVKGEAGNTIALSTDVTGATASGAALTSGVDQGEQPLSFPRVALYTRDGREVVGVPLKLRQATAEYSVRSLADMLAPDPTVDASLIPITSKREKVGPIEEETAYGAGGVPTLRVPYPAADRLLAEYVTGSSGGASTVRA